MPSMLKMILLASTSVAAPLDPLLMPDATVVAYYNADDYTAGDWPDRTANGYDLAQATGANQPAFVADGGSDFNNKAVVRVTSGEFLDRTTTPSLSQPLTVIAVSELTLDNGANKFLVDSGPGGSECGVRANASENASIVAGGFNIVTSENMLDVVTLQECYFDGSSSFIRINSTVAGTGNPGTNGLTGLTIGRNRAGGAPWGGDIRAIIIVDGELTAADREYLARWAEQDSGIAYTPFAPDVLSDLVMWFDAQDGDTVTEETGGVSRWEDKSAELDDAVQATSARRPDYVSSGINGHAAMDFDNGQQEWFDVPDPAGITGSQNRTVFVVAEFDSLATDQVLLGFGTNSTGASYHIVMRGLLDNEIGLGTWSNDYDSTTLIADTDPHLFAAKLDGSTLGGNTLYMDGVSEAASGAGSVNTGTGKARIGQLHDVTGLFDGRIGEILVYARALSDDERQRVEGYLAHKWGLEGNLDSGHPFKNAPPIL